MTPLTAEAEAVLALLERIDPAHVLKLSRPGPRYTSYPTAPEWSPTVDGRTLSAHLMAAAREGAASPLSMYVHIPFCREMCAYCGCNVVVARDPRRADRYLDYLEREVRLQAALLGSRRALTQLHLGGGTPTYLSIPQLERLVRIITAEFTLQPSAEVALEVDPTVTSIEQLSVLRHYGFNRVSMGVQDFTREVQEYVGRVQSLADTERLYRGARDLGYQGINFDLIYGLPKQRLETFSQTLDQVVALGPDRVAVFGYAHVPWMRPNQHKFDEKLLPSPPERFALLGAAFRKFMQAGYAQIGMDHFAHPTDELARARLERRLHRNFQGYTVQPASDIIAVGITAISDVAGCYAQNDKPLARYYRALDAGALPVERGWVLTDDDKVRRRVINQIMCNFYVDLEHEGHGLPVAAETYFAEDLQALALAEQDGLVTRTGLVLELTPLGRLVVRNVAMAFDPYLRRRAAAQGGAGSTFSKTV